MEDLQVQKQQLDTKMFSIQILLDEMGLSEHDSIQDAFNALACAIDDVVN